MHQSFSWFQLTGVLKTYPRIFSVADIVVRKSTNLENVHQNRLILISLEKGTL